MNIIRTGLVNPASDAFWSDISPLIKDIIYKQVLILVQAYSTGSAEESQLQKMLDACGLKEEQYNIIQLNKGQKAAWHGLREYLDPRIIFLIGVTPAQLGISALFQANMPNNFNDRVWLPTLSISELEQQPAIKKQLWLNGMKPVFVDKRIDNLS